MCDILSLEQAADVLGVSTRTVRLWEKLGRIECINGDLNQYHRLEVERLFRCIGVNGLVLSRRPANVFLTSMRKPPAIIDWIGTLEVSDKEAEVECFTYSPIFDKLEIRELVKKSESNGWLRHGYRDIEVVDFEGNYEVVINGKNYFMPPMVNISSWVKEKVDPIFLDEKRLVIKPKMIYTGDYIDRTINACPPFINFYYYDIVGDKLVFYIQAMRGKQKYS